MQLEIEFDSSSAFAVGELLSGRVCAPEGAVRGEVFLRREEELEGHYDTSELRATPLDETGQFQLVMAGPGTYQGAATSVHWTLLARGTVDGRNFTAERPVRISELPENRTFELKELSQDLDPFIENVAHALMLLVAVVVVGVGVWSYLSGAALFGMVMVVAGVAFAVWGGWALLRRTHFKDVQARWENRDDGPVLVLEVEPRRTLQVNGFGIELCCNERTWEKRRSKYGSTTVAVDVPIQSETYRLETPEPLESGVRHTLEIPVQLPLDLPSTFAIREGRLDGYGVVWSAKTRLDVQGAVDWARNWDLEVRPRRV